MSDANFHKTRAPSELGSAFEPGRAWSKERCCARLGYPERSFRGRAGLGIGHSVDHKAAKRRKCRGALPGSPYRTKSHAAVSPSVATVGYCVATVFKERTARIAPFAAKSRQNGGVEAPWQRGEQQGRSGVVAFESSQRRMKVAGSINLTSHAPMRAPESHSSMTP